MRTPAANLSVLVALAFSTPVLQAQLLELAPTTTPTQLQPSITDASVTVTRGLPANITASQLVARLWQGSEYVRMPITSITALGTRKVLRFHVPAIMDPNRVLATRPYATKVEIVNASGAPTITTVIAANTVLLPAPAIDMVWQPYGDRGATVDVTIKGFYTSFPANLTAMTMDFGAGVTAAPKACPSGVSPTQVCATVTVSPTATPGLRNVAVTYGGVTASLANGFAVTVAGPHLLQPVGDTHIRQGQNKPFRFRLDGASIPDPAAVQIRFGAGVSSDVPYQNFSEEDQISTTLFGDYPAATGPRNAVAIVNGEMYAGAGVVIVDPGAAIITSVIPNQAPQGASMSVRIQGYFTGFLQNITSVSMGAGISISSIDVVGPDLAYAQINVSPTAAPGARALSAVTQGESPMPGAIQVTPGIPGICGVTPAMVSQGTTAKVAFQFCFVTPAAPLTVTIPGGGVTAGVAGISGASALVSITADAGATPGVRSGLVELGGRKYPFVFTVLDNAPRLLSVCREPGCESPPVLSPGDRFKVRIKGWNTNFVQGQVQVSVRFSENLRQTLHATVLSPTELLAEVVEAGSLVSGTYPIEVTSAGGGTLTFNGMKIITPPVLTVSPDTGGAQGATVPVTFRITNGGTLPSTCPAFTASGGQPSGISCQNYSVVSPVQATATFVIDPLTPVGGRMSAPVSGSSAAFLVTPGAAALNIKDYAGYPGSNTDLVLNGVGTHWCTTCPSPTKLSIAGLRGQQLTISNFTVSSPTLATARVSGMADPGGYSISMTTAGEVAARANSFEVLPAAPAIRLFLGGSVTPNPASPPGQVWNVYCTYVDGRQASSGSLPYRFAPVQFSAEDFGPGIVVDRIAPANAQPGNYLEPDVSFGFRVSYRMTVSPTAPIGARTLWMRWNGMLTPALFTVTGATPSLTQATPGSLPQGSANFQVILTGKDTTWQQGVSTADFGSGITVLNTAVDTPTSIRLGITIDPIASTGPRTVTVTTGAQSVSATALFSVSAGPAAVSALQPSGGAAGATLDVSVTGSQSNFRQGLTTANFGAGVTVNSVQVSSLTQAVANITIAADAVLGTRTVVLTTSGESAATVPNAFQVTPGLPLITSISPAGGPANQTVSNIQVAGLNLNGATFSVGGTQTLPAIGADPPILTGATVLSVTNLTNTSATLQIQFGAATGVYPLIASNGSGASTSSLTPANQLAIYAGAGYAAASPVTIVNSTPTALDPLRVTPRSATGEPVTVINSQPTVLDPPSRTANYATSASVTVVNSQFTALDPPVRTTRYADSSTVTVLNTQPTPLDPPARTPRYATSYSVNVRNQSAPSVAPSAMTAEAGNRGSQGHLAPGATAGAEEETAFAGQALRIQVEVPAGVQTKGVNVYVNGARLADPLAAPYETVLTVPANVPDLEIKAVVLTGEGEVVAPLRHIKVLPEPESRRLVAIKVRDAEDREVRDAEVTFRYFGFAAEHFRFAQPLARMPEEDPGKDRQPDATGFAAVLHYLPDGADPLGTGALRDTVSRYRSSLQIAETGEYEFRLRASSGALLKVAGEPVAEQQRITLEAGSEVALEVLHYRGIDPSAALHLEWRRAGPNQEFQTIAPEFLRAPAAPAGVGIPWAVSRLDALAVTRGGGEKGQVRAAPLPARQPQQSTILIRVVPQRQEQSRGTNHTTTDSNRQHEEE